MANKCPKCQHENPPGSQKCKDCGAELVPANAEFLSDTETIQVSKMKAAVEDSLIGKYRILGEIGRGGMGLVFKAEDTKLKRTVALKFLPSELTRDESAKKRFTLEAQAASSLDHPNICTIFEIDESDDKRMFISMACYEGESLKDKIDRGPLDIDKAVDIATQIAKGLDKAHKKGIVHRDIKPANVMITEDGAVKIVDFGLAKLAGQVGLSRPDTILGTVAYMSPEQAQGDEVDHRTDIWSLGAMFYEMLTGKRPFQKDHEQALIYAILNEQPEPISSLCPDIPRSIETAVQKALNKKAALRFQSAGEFVEALKKPPLVSSPKCEKSIAVLPFTNMSADPEQEYFCDGMTEEIISDLSKIQSLRVISRTSSMMLKGTQKSLKTIARELNVQYVLEGSVRKAGDNLRITAQLIDAASDAHLWSDKYKGTLDDIFDIQERVARSIVDSLKVTVSPHEDARISEHPFENIQAYDYYLKARKEILSFTEDGFEHAVGHLYNGLKIIGENALLLRGIGFARFQQLNIGVSSDRTLISEIEDYAKRIHTWNSESAHGFFLYGCAAVLKGDFIEAVKQWRRAYEIDPYDPDTLLFLGAHSLSTGQPDFSKKLFEKSIIIDPLVPYNHMLISYADFYMGQPKNSLDSLRKAVKEGSAVPFLMWAAVRIFAASEEMDEAYSVAVQLNKEHPKTMFSKSANALILALRGKKEEALNQITKDLYDQALLDCEWATVLIECYAVVKENEKALDLLEHSIKGGLINYPFLNEYDPFLENIRSDPRFKQLMERVKKEWESFEV